MSDEALCLLRSIDASLKALLALTTQRTAQIRAAQPKPVASDSDLDSQYGDEKVRLNPRDWSGDSFKGRRMSECPPAFLELLADSYDYFARTNEASGALTDKGKPKADFDRRSERRARGWAKRMRDGRHVAPVASGNGHGAWWAEPKEEDGWS